MKVAVDIKNLFEVAFLCLAAYVAYQAHTVILVAIFGFLVAYMLNPVVVKMEKLRIRRQIGAVIIVLVAVGVIAAVAMYLIPEIYNDIQTFISQIPDYITTTFGYINSIAARFNINLASIEVYNESVDWFRKSASGMVQGLWGVAGSLQHAFGLTMNIVLVPMIAFFLLIDFPRMQSFIDEYMGTSNDKGMRKYFYLFSEVMSSYFRGQFIVVLVLCVLYSTALKIAGLNTAILLGTMSGILSIVPYMGFAVGIVASLIMAVIQFQDVAHPIYVIAGFAAVQAIESFYVTPKIMGNSLGLHPVATIIVLMIGGAVFGLPGMIFALPVSAILFQIYKEKFIYLTNPEQRKTSETTEE
jgi:predicted PurR-regulated permease PerM